MREEIKKDVTPPHSPKVNTLEGSPSEGLNSSPKRLCIRSLQGLYEVTHNQNDLTLFCIFVDSEPLNFEEATQS